MPEIVYTVKVVLDPSSEKIVGKAIDEGLEKGVKDAAAAIEKATGKQVTFNKVIEDGNQEIKERNNLLKANVTNVASANAQARNYDNTLKRLITDEKTDIATLRKKAEQHKRFIPVLEESIAEMRAYGAATEMSEQESIKYNNTLSRAERTLRTMMSTNINLSNSLKQAAGEMGDVTGQAGRFNKTMSGANQTLFGFSDLIQDSSQFMVGGSFNFATGMRAIGNNIGFTAELFGNLNQNVDRYNQAVADGTIKNGQQVTTFEALKKSLLGPGGVILAINLAVTVITVLTNVMGRNKKATDEAKDSLSDFASEAELAFSAFDDVAKTLDVQAESLLPKLSDVIAENITQLDLEIKQLNKERDARTEINDEIENTFALRFNRTKELGEEGALIDDEIKRLEESIALRKEESGILESVSEETIDAISKRISEFKKEEEVRKAILSLFADEIQAAEDAKKAALFEKESSAVDVESAKRELDIINETDEIKRIQLEADLDRFQVRQDLAARKKEIEELELDEFQKKILIEQALELEKLELDKINSQERIDIAQKEADAKLEIEERNAQLLNELEKEKLDIRKKIGQSLINVAKVVADKSRGVALALLALEKGKAISEVVVTAQQRIFEARAKARVELAKGNIAGQALALSQVPVIKANAAATIAAITAQGLKQGKQLGGGSSGGGGGGTGAKGYTPQEQKRGFFETDYDASEGISNKASSMIGYTPVNPEFMSSTIVFEGVLDDELLSMRVKEGNAKIEGSTNYLGD
jgi:hypothetical protein